MKNKILIFIISLFLIIPSVNAETYHNYGVTKNEERLIKEEENSRNFVNDLKYRFIEKDTYDSIDYTYLSIIILLMVIIIIVLNKKTYVYFRDQSVFEDEKFIQNKGL